ncbi:NAD-dependent succinate-semialdehyde dehydrogenase [Oceanobacillus polygoni]|uniref:Succinate-semialdehyde dehydrogenase/glutarate-semialdehyde dehydrogenase n=1 Tax=Oceanobacillus polygoni TaxID=1235259 RepID=A0A9X0YRH9_9BACI|nr:NAD-dependent succinate-semialdehyde dehydrogenase [Oceanobacillus polygoni]MBP2076040.1 succinate-semialdehyde dehydrogenase/glutarate-semialdehyde dehydrogenase [Oceanobacillus polygoni]
MTVLQSQKTHRFYINGKWLKAEDDAVIEVINPATNECIANVTSGGEAEAKLAVEAAANAFKEWSRKPAVERANLLLSLYHKVLENHEELAYLVTLESGKPLMQSRMEVKNGAEYIRWNAEEARRIYGTTIESSDSQRRMQIKKEAVGPVAAITPWNFPFAMVARKLSPALAAGCTVALKPSEETPLSAIKFFEIAEEVGFPKGVMNLVIGNPQVIGEVWLTDKRIRKITFTGSTAVGKMLYQKAAKQVKRLSMELGGHAPIIVFEDCNVDKAVQQIVRSKFNNNGQTCISPNRIYVHESVIDHFTEEMGRAVKKFKVGDGTNEESNVGPVINPDGLKKAESHVRDAIDKGAQIVTGGKRYDAEGCEKGFFFYPTVLKDVNETMKVATEETFGPIAPILSFSSEAEVIEKANDTDYGLAAYLFTTDLSRAHRVSEMLEYGMVGVNDTVLSQVEGAFGGVKESGFGREGGPEALEDFLEKKFISTIIE